jgi:hypothetical protein
LRKRSCKQPKPTIKRSGKIVSNHKFSLENDFTIEGSR